MDIKLNEINKRIIQLFRFPFASVRHQVSVQHLASRWGPKPTINTTPDCDGSTQLKGRTEAGCGSDDAAFLIFNKSSRQRKTANLRHRMKPPEVHLLSSTVPQIQKRMCERMRHPHGKKKKDVRVFGTERNTSVHR